ncbi:hypothetical protein MANES_08G155275v8 [Manihot esculenta]|uniref:Uncharacterized protein n=1 Tax=Manihot esculenta TaxID=3983 RepID=A0ACB7HCI8_MANES|nr:hypothetical protein MANES_08G155275v8 [Manihot esculenta]
MVKFPQLLEWLLFPIIRNEGAGYALVLFFLSGHRYPDYANSFQREEPPYHGCGRDYYKCKNAFFSVI